MARPKKIKQEEEKPQKKIDTKKVVEIKTINGSSRFVAKPDGNISVELEKTLLPKKDIVENIIAKAEKEIRSEVPKASNISPIFTNEFYVEIPGIDPSLVKQFYSSDYFNERVVTVHLYDSVEPNTRSMVNYCSKLIEHSCKTLDSQLPWYKTMFSNNKTINSNLDIKVTHYKNGSVVAKSVYKNIGMPKIDLSPHNYHNGDFSEIILTFSCTGVEI